jgi:ABC-type uncharacterized transport system substrate-binding protein
LLCDRNGRLTVLVPRQFGLLISTNLATNLIGLHMNDPTPQEIENAFSMMVLEKADAVIVGSPTVFAQQHRQIAELALKYRMPSLFQDRVTVEVGGLMSYGQKFTASYERSATYVDKILKGAKPGDLPVEQPVSFERVVNLKTAKALGVTIPQTILLRADEVIE